MRIVSFDDFIDLPRTNIDWIVEGLIPRPGMVELMGPPKTGKSFLAMDLAFRVARGEHFMSRPTKQSKVLYLQLDTSERVMRDRGVALRQAGYDTKAPAMCVVHPADVLKPLNIMTSVGADYLRKALLVHDPSLVIVDTLRELHQEDENDSTAMKSVMDTLEHLMLTRAILLVHHTNKISPDNTQPTPVQVSRGSSYITGKVDAFWLLHNGSLRIESRWDEPLAYTARQDSSGMFTFPTIAGEHILKAHIAKLCQDHPQMTHTDLAREANKRHGISRSTYMRILATITCAHQASTPLDTKNP